MENEKKEVDKEKKTTSKKMDKKKIIFISISAVVLILLGTFISQLSPKTDGLDIEEAKTKAETFINTNLMMPGTTATITAIVEEYGLYKISVDTGSGEIIDSYISRDGDLFFPQSINIDEYGKENTANTSATNTEITNKQEKPVVELFVMSHCPYGTQMEKALLPVMELLKNNLDFTLKFNSYAMHDKVELDEQMTQYCIQKEDRNNLIPYVNCFNKSEDSAKCLSENKIDSNKIKSCVSATDKEYKITAGYNDKTTWLSGTYPVFSIFQADNDKYGVEGSPTLVINGELTSSNDRSPKALLELVCSSFVNAPSECQTELSDVAPGYGFGE